MFKTVEDRLRVDILSVFPANSNGMNLSSVRTFEPGATCMPGPEALTGAALS